MGTIFFATAVLDIFLPVKNITEPITKLKKKDRSPHFVAKTMIFMLRCFQPYWDLHTPNSYAIAAIFALPLCDDLQLNLEFLKNIPIFFYDVMMTSNWAVVLGIKILVFVSVGAVEPRYVLKVISTDFFLVYVFLVVYPIVTVLSVS